MYTFLGCNESTGVHLAFRLLVQRIVDEAHLIVELCVVIEGDDLNTKADKRQPQPVLISVKDTAGGAIFLRCYTMPLYEHERACSFFYRIAVLKTDHFAA